MRSSCKAAALGLLAAAATAQSHAACRLEKFLELPVTVSGARALVPVKLNGTDANMMLDTGAFYSFLSRDIVDRLKLPLGSAPFGLQITGIGGNMIPQLATVRKFGIGYATIPNSEFLVAGNAGTGPDYAGTIGQNLLRLGDAEFDFANGAVRLLREKGCSSRDLPYWGQSGYGVLGIEPTSGPKPEIVTTVTINGVQMRALIDSGSQFSMLSLHGASRAGISRADAGVTSGGVIYGIGRRRFDSWIVPVKSLKLDTEQILNTRLRIIDSDLSGLQDMVLGIDFLLSHRLYVAYGMNKLFFTYNGGPVFDLRLNRGQDAPASQVGVPPAASSAPGSAPAALSVTPLSAAAASSAPATDSPQDAAGFDRRGTALAARGELTAAIADFSRAIELDATGSEYPYHRALARLRNHQPVLAMADLDQALQLAPGLEPALLQRAELRLAGHDLEGAHADFAAAVATAPADPTLPLREAFDYLRTGEYSSAESLFSAWAAAHPHDERLTDVLEGRCQARAMQGTHLDDALADCNQALRRSSATSPLLTGRALVYLRRGDADQAIVDADAALNLQPQAAETLYIRGLARLRKGDRTAGEADIAAATRLAPNIEVPFRRAGLTP